MAKPHEIAELAAEHDHILPRSLYYGIFGILMVLTVLTVAAAYVDLGNLNIIVAIAIALVKATFVILFFMHVKYSSKLTWVVVGAGVFWLLILLSLLMLDYGSRGWMPIPPIVHG
jgi:cytochrome c oxidase subunit IV